MQQADKQRCNQSSTVIEILYFARLKTGNVLETESLL